MYQHVDSLEFSKVFSMSYNLAKKQMELSIPLQFYILNAKEELFLSCEAR